MTFLIPRHNNIIENHKKLLVLAIVAAAWSHTLDASPISASDGTQKIERSDGANYLSDEGGTLKAIDIIRAHKGAVRFARASTPRRSATPSFTVDIPVVETRTILASDSSATTSPRVPKIMNPYGFNFRNNPTIIFLRLCLAASFSAFAGLMFFLARRRKLSPPPPYVLYVASMIVLLSATETIANQFLAHIFPNLLNDYLVLTIFLFVAARSYYCTHVLRTKIMSENGHKFMTLLAIFALTASIFSAMNPKVNLWTLAEIFVLLNFVMSIGLSYKTYRKGLHAALYFLLGSIFLASFTAIARASEIGLVPAGNFFNITLLVGATLEIFCLGIAHSKGNKVHAEALALEFKKNVEETKRLNAEHTRNLEREKSAEFSDSMFSNLPVSLVLIDHNLRIIRVNNRFHDSHNINIHELSDFLADEKSNSLVNQAWNLAELRQFLLEALQNTQTVNKFVIKGWHLQDYFVFNISAQRVISLENNLPQLLLCIENASEASHMQLKLSKAAEIAAQSSNAKTEFLANMSHEIRTPLSIIIGYAEILAQDQKCSATQQSHVDKIVRSSTHLLALVGEVLDMSKIESGMLEINPVEIDLFSELQETFTLLSSRVQARGLYFDVQFVGSIPTKIFTCPLRLRQIIINIVGNAAKFTDIGGVSVKVTHPSTRILSIEVRDTGCGLTSLQQERLFQPFVQADPSTSRKYGGTGLGLALSRQLAQAMGGNIELCWSRIDEGSSFLITIDPGATSNPKTSDHGTWQAMNVMVTEDQAPSLKINQLRLLLVEDSPELRELIKIYIEAAGANLDMAKNGEEGVALCLSNTYNLVLMDIQMPVLDGYQATSKLISLGYKPPIIALTAHAVNTERDRCMAGGFSDYLAKPIRPQDLIGMIRKHTRST